MAFEQGAGGDEGEWQVVILEDGGPSGRTGRVEEKHQEGLCHGSGIGEDRRLESPGGSIPQDPVVGRAIWLFL